MDVEPDHDFEPALSLFSHVRPLRQDSHNTEGEGDQKLSGEDIIKSICIIKIYPVDSMCGIWDGWELPRPPKMIK